MMNAQECIEQRLREVFAPTHLKLEDESHQHVGHAGAQGGRHYALYIQSAQFEGQSRVHSHRMIYDALNPLDQYGIHALKISILK